MQFPVGAVRPADAQYIPGVHALHWLASERDDDELKVPGAQSVDTDWPGAQKEPRSHGDGFTVAPPQRKPPGQGRQTDCPLAFWKAPGAQGRGTLLPAGQLWPGGHRTDATATPPAQRKPASQRSVGKGVAELGHVNPLLQGKHDEALVPPVPLRNEPGGQGIGVVVPAWQ